MTLMIDGGWNPCECDLADFISEYNIEYLKNDELAKDDRIRYRCTNHDIKLTFNDFTYAMKFDDRDQLYYHLCDMRKGYSTNLELLGQLAIDLPVTKIKFTAWYRIKYFLFPVRLKTN